jgi:hypothetical protein
MYISTLEPCPPAPDFPSFAAYAAPYFELQHRVYKYLRPALIRTKTTHSTNLAADAPKTTLLHLVPAQFCKYYAVFSERASQRLPQHQPWDHAIDLKPDSKFKSHHFFRLNPAETVSLKEYLTDHLKRGYIRPSKSPIASNFFFVGKKDGKLRPVQDYRDLNNITIKNATPLLLIPDLIDKLQGARYFTKFDIRWGYNNICIKHGDEWKATFKCCFGLFKPLVMTFGLCNAPATFQSFMNSIFSDLVDSGHLVVYLDDILLFHDNLPDLHALTHDVLSRLQKHDLYLKPKKCSFDQTSIDYLGVIISHGQVKMDPAKLSGITAWPLPKKLKDLRVFLGFCNFYRHFIKDYSSIARPLFELSKKDTPFIWHSVQDSAFHTLIKAFTTAPVLGLPDPTLPFRVITDANDFALGAVLEQPDALNRWHPVAFYYKSMLPAELNYDIHDKELLAIVCALETFRHYLEGHPQAFEVWTDHNNLAYFRTKQKISRHQAHWSLFLSQFNFAIIHKPGAFNKADALSRRPDLKEGMPPADEQRVLLTSKFFSVRATRPMPIEPATPTIRQRIKAAQVFDSEVNSALNTILHNGPRSLTKGLNDWNLEDSIVLYRGHIYVPKDNSLRRDLIKLYHDHPAIGHPG